MPEPIHTPDAYTADTGDVRGRGVFAARAFRAGETVEIAPVMLLSTPEAELEMELRRRLFDWPKLGGAESGMLALAFGYGSLYNHANPANMRYAADSARRAMVFTAARAIARDEELSINYNAIGGGHVWDDDHWFQTYGVDRV